MTGLRERQKADRTQRILQAASALFRSQGYDTVRIEDIAAAAEVSTGTCYNYFSTKGDLLLAIVSMEVQEVVDAGRPLVAAPPDDVAQALKDLIRLYYDHSLNYLSKEMWRKAMAISIEAPTTPFSRQYTQLDALLAAQVCDLLAALRDLGLTRADLQVLTLGQIIFHALNQLFMEFVTHDTMQMVDLHRRSEAQTMCFATLMQP